MVYPLVKIQKTMENHHFQWENPLYMAIFNSYDCMFIRGFYLNRSFSMVESPSSRDPLSPPLGTLCSKEGFDVAEVRVASRQIHQSHFLQPSARARARRTWRFCQVVLISRTSTDSVFKVSILRKLPKCPFLNVRNGRNHDVSTGAKHCP